MAAMALAVVAGARAQKVYTLDECREMALQNNVKARNAANEVEAARQGKKEAFTKYFPSVSATGMGYNANKGLLQMDMGEGMNMSLLKNGVMGGVTVTQPVFAGGQIINSNKLADVGVEVSNIQKEQDENDVRLTVEMYYWQVVTLQEKLATLRTVEKQLESINKDVEVAVNAGVTTRNDLLQVQLKTQRHGEQPHKPREQPVCVPYVAGTVRRPRHRHHSHRQSHTYGEKPPFPDELHCDHASSLPLTTGYRLLQSDVKANKIKQRLEVGKNLPSVVVGGGYMYDDLMDKAHPFAIGFVTVSVPISDWWGGSHAIKKQKLEVKNAENRLADNSELLVIAMQKAWTDLQDSYKQILIATKSIEQSTENLRLNEDYYRAGTTTMSDLLDAQSMFRQSHDKYADAYAQFRIKTMEYLQATGR